MAAVLVMLVLLLLTGHAAMADANPTCPSIASAAAARLIQTTCRELRQELASIPGVTVRHARSSFQDERKGCIRTGCVVTLRGSFKAVQERDSPESWPAGYLRTKGWTRMLSYDADGPNGSSYAVHQPGAICLVSASWNHWDDDSGPHLADTYTLTVSCGYAERDPPE